MTTSNVFDFTTDNNNLDYKFIFKNAEDSISFILPDVFEEFFGIHHNELEIVDGGLKEGKHIYWLNSCARYTEAQLLSYCFLAHLSTPENRQIYIYQNIVGPERRQPVLTLVEPDKCTVTLAPTYILEVVFFGLQYKFIKPEIKILGVNGVAAELIRREHFANDDYILQKNSSQFAAMRWKRKAYQTHFFFNFSHVHYKHLLLFTCRMIRACQIIFKINDESKVIDVDVPLYKTHREDMNKFLKLKSNRNSILIEANSYGTSEGLTGDHFVIGERTTAININSIFNDLIVEIPVKIPCEDRDVPEDYRWSAYSKANEDGYLGFSIEMLDDRIINNVLFQRYKLHSMSKYSSRCVPVGRIIFTCANGARTIAVYSSETKNVSHDTAIPAFSTYASERKTYVEPVKKKRDIVLIGFKEIETEVLSSNCVLITLSGDLDAIESNKKEVFLENPKKDTIVKIRANQTIKVRQPLLKENGVFMGVWNIVRIPTFLTNRFTKRANSYEEFEIEADKPHPANSSGTILFSFTCVKARYEMSIHVVVKKEEVLLCD